MTAATRLAAWIYPRARRYGKVDHLKLQKLVFYSYGAALAQHLEAEVGLVTFEPWKHGPVNREIWNRYRAFGAEPLPPPDPAPAYSDRVTRVLEPVTDVYARLSAWAIRCESHLEAPWADAWREQRTSIDNEDIRAHFVRKFAPGHVELPAHLGGAGAYLEGIPAARFESLDALAARLRTLDQVRRAGGASAP